MEYDNIRNCQNIYDYLDLIKQTDYMVIVCVKDTAGFWFNDILQNQFYNLGFKESLIKKLMVGYIGISWNSKLLYENLSEKDGCSYYSEKIAHHHISVLSKPYVSGNLSSIMIDGKEFSCNKRGLNIVIYDISKNTVVDSVSFDTHVEKFSCSRININQNIEQSADLHLGKSHYDACLVGCWWGANYGSCLNGYAVYKVLESFGLSVLMLNKHNATVNDWEITNTHNAKFINNFYPKEEVSPIIPFNQLYKLNDYCDTFVVGSDQIWNYGINKLFNMAFMLNFVDDSKRKLSFGTSFGHGMDGTPKDQLPYLKMLLKRFDAISLREESGVNICENVYNVRANQVLEPVFCLEKSQYDELAEHSTLSEEKPYFLTYILDPTPEKREAIKFYEKISGLKAINVLDGDPRVYDRNKKALDLPNIMGKIGSEDLMKLYQGCSFVISDSFHGTAFSIIFNKPFLSIANAKRGIVRFKELLGKFNLMERLAMDSNNIPHDPKFLASIDYSKINSQIENERKKSISWLKDAISIFKSQKEDVIPTKSINFNLNPDLCTGCGACSEICPVHAIKMEKDKEGFLKPVVDSAKCVNCELCTKKCIVLNPEYKNNSNPKCYAMMASDEIRKISSSGGMFTVAAEYVLNFGGYVCGAAYKDNFEVEHIIIDKKEDLYKLRGSKYIQSESGKIYPKIKELLEKDKYVLFTGMPCQVAGLHSYLRKDYEKLYTIDLFCHGITSYKVFEKYHHDVLGGKTLTRLEFKEKQPWGWHAGINAYFNDGTKYSKKIEIDPYFNAYIGHASKNTACGVCKANRLPRQGDLTMGDFWRVQDFDRSLNDNKGTSAVLVNNLKGQEFFDKLKKNMAVVKEAPLQIAITGNRCIENPYPLNKNRNMFFKYFDKLDFESLTKGCLENCLYEQLYLDLVKTVPKEDHEFYYMAKLVAQNANGRKIVTWIRSSKFERVLKQYFGLTVAFGISQRAEALVPGKIEAFTSIKGKSNEYYLVSLDRKYDAELYKTLNAYGYQETKDFIFRMFKPIVLQQYDLSKGNYFDQYGNTIEGYNTTVGKVVFRGFNNHITFGKSNFTAKNLDFNLGANTLIKIGDNTRFNLPSKVEMTGFYHESSLKIGKNCNFSDANFRFFSNEGAVSALINDNCTSSSQFDLHVNQGKRIIIGKDCMFSYEIELWAGDGHTLFDVTSGKNINGNIHDTFSINNQLVIGDHVWVGKQAFLMHGTNIGNGSIVGARSFVKGIFPNNCSIGGNPAKKIKDNVAWSRDSMATDIKRCGAPENVAMTSNAKAPISGMKVLVIGGTKFMGVELVKELISKGNRVTIANRGRAKDSFGASVDRLIMDVSNEESVKNALRGKYFDVVFDNIAYCSLYVNNILSNVKCGKYIQLSSIAVYKNRNIGLSEKDFIPNSYPYKLVDGNVQYGEGKRQAECAAYQNYPNIPTVTVRIPYVTNTERIYFYCKCIAKQIPMNIDSERRGFTFVRSTEVGKFLPWIAAQNFTGSINLASKGIVTVGMMIEYIERKIGKKAIYSADGAVPPFREKTFNIDMNVAEKLGYVPSDLDSWFWELLDRYIARALREK